MDPLLIVGVLVVLFAVFTVMKSVRIVPQARARNVERLGRYHTTLKPGLNFVIPYIDRVYPMIDLREQVVSFRPQPVITEDNLVVEIDTVLYFQVTDPRAAAYEIANYIQAIEQLTVTTLRNVIGSMDLEMTLTSRDTINSQLRGVLDEATGKWGIRVNRVEIKAIDPPKSIKDAMEKQMRAERDKRASILNAEGQRQSQILTAEGDKQSAILRAEGERSAAILKAQGQSQAIDEVFQAVHRNDPDPKLLAYQYLQVLPELAKGQGNTFWVIPSEVTSALQGVSRAFTESLPASPATRELSREEHVSAAKEAAEAQQAAAEAVAEATEATAEATAGATAGTDPDAGPRQLGPGPVTPDALAHLQDGHLREERRHPAS
ncbi:SPFH/Band 7/PHB domain protein [Planomonospora sp. ID67723]|uniref:SPFH domain-containing protein n=1 Tax=Planomonospora sp. ID67723 TaxID=2738134 RepID=UPI0018C37041|nr:SPFH domain-containing protein [Planomonospora sp. ID67723]MBG0826425.1 SPFH/Band 7/PHB domain protein [Planomonospora sp. ID67723]